MVLNAARTIVGVEVTDAAIEILAQYAMMLTHLAAGKAVGMTFTEMMTFMYAESQACKATLGAEQMLAVCHAVANMDESSEPETQPDA
jgi:hypothetical protein